MARARQKNGLTVPRALARVGDPLVCADGRVVQPDSATKDIQAGQPKMSADSFRPSKKRTLKEMPAPVDIINGIACIFLYTIMGVGDREMADALKISVSDVRDIRKHPGYAECFDSIVGEFISVNSELIQARIAAYGHEALSSVASIAINGKQEVNKLRASTDLLDRGGFTKKDNAARGMTVDTLRIIVTKGDGNVQVDVGGSGMVPQ